MTAPGKPRDRSMPEEQRLPLWQGRALALLGILLLALSLRTAVTMISPILDHVGRDLPLDGIVIGVLGMLPPAVFSLAGVITPAVSRTIGLESALVAACLAMVAGLAFRGFAPSTPVLVLATALTFMGIGVGNVLLPPAVKRYFPDRIPLLTIAYVVAMAVSATVPAAVAVPLAERFGWRVSLVAWSMLAMAALIPWILLRTRHRTRRFSRHTSYDQTGIQATRAVVLRPLYRSRIAISLAVLFSVSALNVYSAYAWLPGLLHEHARVSLTEAGTLLGYYALLGLPFALVIPLVASRAWTAKLVVLLAVVLFEMGYLGFLLAPGSAPWLWVTLIGIAPAMLFPLWLLLFNTRTRTTAGATALSGYAHGIAYAVAALGPLVIGYLHELVGEWSVSILVLLSTVLVAVPAVLVLSRPGYLEDELADSATRRPSSAD